jgi:ACS family hexuronate transporter-like MFS transporter
MEQSSKGWIAVFMLFMVYMINYLDRVALSIAAPLIQHDLGMTTVQLGVIFSSFFFGYTLFNFIGGLATDKLGPKLIFVMAVGCWSIFCGMTAMTVGFASLLVVRVLFGMAEGPLCAGANKMVNNWFPQKKAATAMGIVSAGSPLGGAIAGPVVGTLAVVVGWRLAFVVVCCLGLVWVGFWMVSVRNTPDTTSASSSTAADVSAAISGAAGNQPALGLGGYMKQPTIWATGMAFFCYNYVLFFFLSWFPSYLTQAYHLNIKAMSIATVIPWVVGAIGLVAGGVISDWIFRITGRVHFSRKLVLGVCLACSAACVAMAGTVTTAGSAVLLMSVALFFLYVTGAIYWAVVQDVVHSSKVGSVSGTIHFLGSLSGIIGPVVTGVIVQSSGSFTMAFILAGGIALLGAIVSTVFIQPPQVRTEAKGMQAIAG